MRKSFERPAGCLSSAGGASLALTVHATGIWEGETVTVSINGDHCWTDCSIGLESGGASWLLLCCRRES